MRFACIDTREQFSAYVDGLLTAESVEAVRAHAAECRDCRDELAQWQSMCASLRVLAPVQPTSEAELRLQIAASKAALRTGRWRIERWVMMLRNSVAPVFVQVSAGLASSLAVLTLLGVLIGMFAASPVSASDEPLGLATQPHFLYSQFPDASIDTSSTGAIVVEVFTNANGRVYDYKILAGENDARTRDQLNNLLYFSVFQPATAFGQPVRGHTVMSFAGFSVRG
jgi:hypothetical protein